jgi:chemotaxis protein CheZ
MSNETVPQVVSPESETHLENLISAFQTGDVDQINDALEKLGTRSESDLYQRVGELTRTLHQSLLNLQKNLKADNTTMDSTTIPDAASKLESIIEMTRESAHTTMESTEKQEQIFEKSTENLEQGLELLDELDESQSALRNKLSKLLLEEKERVEQASALTTKILMSQEYQDLTGQVLRKVIKLVSEMEDSLLDLVQVFGGNNYAPEATPEESDRGGLEQDDVDDILSNLGF